MPILAPLVRAPRPQAPFAVWDVEARPAYDGEPVNTSWLGGGVYDGQGKPLVIRSRDKFFQHLLSDTYRGHWLYAHNGSGYDFRYLIAYLCERGIPWDGFASGSRMFIRVADREFVDSMAVLPFSLDEAARKLGAAHRKQSVPEDFYQRIDKYDWVSYLGDDLYALYDCIVIMREATAALGCQLKRTLAATAVDLWQRNYLTGRYAIADAKHPVEAAAREAYAGGRCEVFRPRIGAGTYWKASRELRSTAPVAGEYWDINSSYPTAMLAPVPVEVLPLDRSGMIPDFGLVYAEYDIPHDDFIPPLFHRGADERLYHPTGVWSGWRTADEARYLVELYGHNSVRVKYARPFAPHDIFSGYVRDLYAKRQAPGPVGIVAKRLLNSLYGRMGMRRERERMVSGPLPSYPVSMISRALCVWTEPVTTMQHSATIMPWVAATITARGRIALHRYLRQAPEPAYCDTDSVTTGGRMPLMPSAELGGCKREAEIIEAEFTAPKAYRILSREGESYHVKGMPRRDLALLADYLAGRPVRVGRVPGIREAMRRGLAVDGTSEIQRRHHTAGVNRHPEGRPYRIEEVEGL